MSETGILIIGGGVAGLSTAWHLARQGRRDVVVVEREPHLGSQSSGLNAAILRTLGPDSLMTRIGLESAKFLRTPPDGFTDVPLIDRRGLLMIAGPKHADALKVWSEAVGEDCGAVACSAARVRALFPPFEAEVAFALHCSEEGQIDIAALIAGFARGARQGGVELRRRQSVRSLLVDAGRVVGAVLADGESIRAESVVIAAGGWAGELGRAAGSRVALRPTRRHLLITAPSDAIDSRWPVLWWLEDGEFYCRPDSGGLLLCACDLTDVDPNHCDRDSAVRAGIAEKASRLLPSLQQHGASAFWCGVRTLTADGRFAIGPDPDVAGLHWVAGLGGSGMVCGAEVGRIAAASLLGEALPPEVRDGFDPARLCPERDRGPAIE